MAKNTYNSDIDLSNNQLLNARLQNLGVDPSSNLYEGNFWINTNSHIPKYYDGTSIKEFGRIYTFNSDSFTNTNDTITLNIATASTLGGVKIGSNININSTSGVISVADASTTTKGVIEIATDQEATTGTSETLAVNPKQLATAISGLIKLTDFSIASSSTNYLEYDNTNGQFGAKVDTTVTASSTNLVTSGAVASAISTALTGALVYQGTWTATGQTDYSSITLPVEKGYMYAVSGTATIGGIEWNSGDYLVIKNDVASDGTISSSDVEKIDNTESSDIVRLSSTQTLTNKTIDADDNTISDLTTSNFKSGTIVTSIGSTGSDTAIPTEKAVRNALSARVISSNNPALTASGGEVTWTISNTIGTTSVVVQVFEISTNKQIMCEVAVTASTITIKMNASSNVAANTYRAIIIG